MFVSRSMLPLDEVVVSLHDSEKEIQQKEEHCLHEEDLWIRVWGAVRTVLFVETHDQKKDEAAIDWRKQ